MEITLRVLPNVTGGDVKNNVTKNCVAKFKSGNPKELINWRIWLNHVIQNKLCKLPESWFDMSQAKGLPILGVLGEDEEESSGEDKDDKEKGKKDERQISASVVTLAGITKETYSS
eukprot:5422032-Ditylum_brightwellii.AAC.1